MQAQLLSNEASALIATVNQTEAAAESPFSYSLDRFIPSHAMDKVKLKPQQLPSVTGYRKSQTITFNMPRTSWVNDMQLNFEVGWNVPNTYGPYATGDVVGPLGGAATAGGSACLFKFGGLGALSLVKRITWESATRTLYELSGEAIQAMVSDLSADAQLAICNGMHCTVDPFTNNNAGYSSAATYNGSGGLDREDDETNLPADEQYGRLKCSLPILMCITGGTGKLAPCLQFLESCRMTVQFADNWQCGNVFFARAAPADGEITEETVIGGSMIVPPNALEIHNAELCATFIQLPKQWEEAVIADNFSSAVLTSLTYSTERLQPVRFTLGDKAEIQKPVSIRLDSTKTISDIYFFWKVRRTEFEKTINFTKATDQRLAAVGCDCPCPIGRVTLELSGEKVLDEYPAHNLSMYGRRTTSGEHGGFFAVNPLQQGFKNRIKPVVSTQQVGAAPADIGLGMSNDGAQSVAFDAMNSCYVYKIDMSGINSNNKTYSSGFTSLRSINVPTLTIHLDQQYTIEEQIGGVNVYRPRRVERFPKEYLGTAGLEAELHVVLRTGALTSVSGDTGKTLNVLSN